MNRNMVNMRVLNRGFASAGYRAVVCLTALLLVLVSGCDRSSSTPLAEEPHDTVDQSDYGDEQRESVESYAPASVDDASLTERKAVLAYSAQSEAALDSSGYGLRTINIESLQVEEQQSIARASGILAKYLDVPDVASADIVEFEAQIWEDSSLDCAEPNEKPSIESIEGHRVVFVLNGVRHQVHTTDDLGRVCGRLQGMLQLPKRALKLGELPNLQIAAVSELAETLGVSSETIIPLRVEPKTWEDSSLGCPADKGVRSYGEVNGYILPFKVAGRRYDYRTDGRKLVTCKSEKVVESADR